MKKETKIQYAQFIEQRQKIDGFEDKAIKDLLRYYTTAKKATNKSIQAAIKKNSNYPSRERLQRVYKEADSMVKVLTDKLTKPIAQATGEAGAFSYKDTNRILSWDGRVKGFDNVTRSAAQIGSMVQDEKLGGKYLDDWLWSAMREENGALKAEIASAQIRGVGYKELMGELGGRYDNMLSAKGNKQNIETVTKSYIQSANAKAHEDIYEANKDIIDRVEWSAIMENGNTTTGRGTCPRCAALDGEQYKSTKSAPSCPLHPRCRCMLLPITKTWRELGIDVDEMDEIHEKWYIRSPGRKILSKGTIDGNYADWWMTRSKSFQDNAIGPTRADLVRSKQIGFNDIVDKNGKLILLKDLGVTELNIGPINKPYTTTGLLNTTFGEDGGYLITIEKCDE